MFIWKEEAVFHDPSLLDVDLSFLLQIVRSRSCKLVVLEISVLSQDKAQDNQEVAYKKILLGL